MLSVDLQHVAALMREVGQNIILPRWRNLKDGEVSEKTGPHDLVTIADQEAEAALTPRLQALLPGSLVLGEESFAADPGLIAALRSEHPVWIIDPVDGTKPFAEGKETFGTIIALVQKDEILTGWIHHPLTGDMLVTERGAGAFWNGQRVQMRESQPLAAMTGIVGVRLQLPLKQYPGPGAGPTFERSSFVACQIYPAMIAEGSMFGLPAVPRYHFRATASYSRPWDDAAGALAVREAGGEIIDWDGNLYRPTMFDNGTIVATDYASAIAVRDWLLPAYQAARAI
jgi:fructose-1,6-bisphosphatase/inositol monophosphatase family enzyme